MKRLMCVFALLFSTAAFSATPAPASSQKETSLIKPEVDKTDIFAIPEDTSEEEEKEEVASLDKLQKYEQAKKAKEKADSMKSK